MSRAISLPPLARLDVLDGEHERLLSSRPAASAAAPDLPDADGRRGVGAEPGEREGDVEG
jgi:hypothetical protein